MWCEAGQKDCLYLDGFKQMGDKGLLGRALAPENLGIDVDVMVSEEMEDASRRAIEYARNGCSPDYCGALQLAAYLAVLNTSEITALSRVVDTLYNTRPEQPKGFFGRLIRRLIE